MTSLLRARPLLAVAAAGSLAAVTVLVGPSPVQATTGTMAYDCTAPGIGTQPLDFELDTNAPAKMYVGRTYAVKLNVKVVIPGFVIFLAKAAQVTQADATGDVTVGLNGRSVVGHAVYPRTQLPDGGDFPVNLPVPLPRLTPTAAGTLTYRPGPLSATLHGYDAAGVEKGKITASCTVKTAGKVIDKVTVVKSPTAVTTAAAYAKSAKRLTAVTKVTARSGVVATGKVRTVLYRGTTKLATITRTLSGGRATAVFGSVRRAGTYKLVTTYAGSHAHLGSKATRRVVVR